MALAELAKKDTGLQKDVYDKLSEHYPGNVLQWVNEADWELKDIPLSKINMARRPGGRNMDKVKNIAKAIKEGKRMDPIFLVKQSDGSYQIADGYHRTLGFQYAGKAKIAAYVASGVDDDGPWDKEMHEKKLNVEPGKKASEEWMGLAKLAEIAEEEVVEQPHELGILPRLGILAGTTGLGAGAGFALDHRFKSLPIGTALGGLAGLTAGSLVLGDTPSPDQISQSALATYMLARELHDMRMVREEKAQAEVEKNKMPAPETSVRQGTFKTAMEDMLELSKVARQLFGDAMKARSQTMIKMQKAKEFQKGRIAALSPKPPGVKGDNKEWASFLGSSRMAAEDGAGLAKLGAPNDAQPVDPAKEDKKEPTHDRQWYLDRVGKKQDKNGWYVCTHRARSKSYPTIEDIPFEKLKFVESTG